MANTYKWKINALDAKIQENDLENVIYTIHYTFIGQDDSEEPVQAITIGTLGVTYNPEDPFIEYADLTKDDVVGWLEDGLDVESMKENIDKQIELKKNPIDETLRPDWD